MTVVEIILVELAVLGAATPFVGMAFSWMRRTTAQIAELNVTVAAASARQDTILADHERRIVDLEHAPKL